MRATTVFIAVLLASCTRPAPNTCCVTEEQCDAFGVDEIRPCEAGQACAPNFTCVAKECDSSAECTSPDKPICSLGLCVASCQVDDDCADVAGKPFCAADGACVGCEQNDQCPTDAAFCDAEDRACRGCERDDECESGVCLEADGRCAAEAEVLFVNGAGGQDVGDCPKSAPCDTINYALTRIATGRDVIHVDGGTSTMSGAATVSASVYIDGTDTTLAGTVGFTVNANKIATFGRLRFLEDNTTSGIAGSAGSTVKIFDSNVARQIETSNGLLEIARSTFSKTAFCQSGTLVVGASVVARGAVDTFDCQVTVTRTRFDDADFQTVGGGVTFENNLAVISNGAIDFMKITTATPTSSVRFNTFVNTTSVPSTGLALDCQPGLDVSSNVFAYRSTQPLRSNGCRARFSVFDEVAVDTSGEGNQVAADASIFVDRNGGDFHPGATSVAKRAAQPDLVVTDDFDGKPRPQPAGTTADVGAFEAP